jgi:hypothetical protein
MGRMVTIEVSQSVLHALIVIIQLGDHAKSVTGAVIIIIIFILNLDSMTLITKVNSMLLKTIHG